MNRKGHHEVGIAPYVLLVMVIGFISLFVKRIYYRLKKRS